MTSKVDDISFRREQVRGLRANLKRALSSQSDGATVSLDCTTARRLTQVCVMLEQFLSGERI